MAEGRNLTHMSNDGSANMVDISDKVSTHRTAIASGRVRMQSETLNLILAGNSKKGDVIGIARIAGIMAAKRTHDLIPLCHPLQLSNISVEIERDESLPGLTVKATVKTAGRTGVEMEALTAVSVACLTLYDMAKAVDRGMVVEEVRVVQKSGGQSGDWKTGGSN